MEDTNRGIPTHCRCGSPVSRHTSKTKTNPGRLFHSCPYGDEHNPGHLFKWTDLSILEEIEDIKADLEDVKITTLANDKCQEVSESKLQSLSLQTRTCCTLIQKYQTELNFLEQDIKRLKGDLKCLKNISFCAVLTVIMYKCFM
ncbi:unnamed protein product [Eruca vesicaria subsp. sativa]|uniref:GRF-type domain-containing protein n=1 Tax=Eruca vesicaria subsp. sativa TaxID=29727 RepID=A0ABC8JLL9_ERUVS|nr:unnamed protein product [Eruca vesicaria subsp. sativa]